MLVGGRVLFLMIAPMERAMEQAKQHHVRPALSLRDSSSWMLSTKDTRKPIATIHMELKAGSPCLPAACSHSKLAGRERSIGSLLALPVRGLRLLPKRSSAMACG